MRLLGWMLTICVLFVLLAMAESGCCPPSLPVAEQRPTWLTARGSKGVLSAVRLESPSAGRYGASSIDPSPHPGWLRGSDLLWARRVLRRALGWFQERLLAVELIWFRAHSGEAKDQSESVATHRVFMQIASLLESPTYGPVVSVGIGEAEFGYPEKSTSSPRASGRHRGSVSARSASRAQQLALLLIVLGTPWLLLVLVDAVARFRMRQWFAKLGDRSSGSQGWRGRQCFQLITETPLGRRNAIYQRRQWDDTNRASRERDSTVRLLETIQVLAEAMDASRQTNNWRSQLSEPPLGRAARPAPPHGSGAHTVQVLTVPVMPVKRDGTPPGLGRPATRDGSRRGRSRRRTAKVLWTREAA